MTGSGTRQSFSRAITARAERRPDEVAVISEHEGITPTCAEVDARSNALAREYLARGVRRDDPVAVALPDSAEFVVTCAAVWKAGATPLRNQAGKVRRSTFRNPHHRRYTAKV